MANPQKVIHGLSNRAIFNNPERPQTQISRSDMAVSSAILEIFNAEYLQNG